MLRPPVWHTSSMMMAAPSERKFSADVYGSAFIFILGTLQGIVRVTWLEKRNSGAYLLA